MPTIRPALAAALALALAVPAAHADASAAIGQPAPAFTLTDATGASRSLEEFRGRTVVLEWTNHECPFVRKHYESRNIPGQQGAATGDGVAWLVINSSAPGKQGHVDAAQATSIAAGWGGAQTAYLFDASGDVGRAYDAKTTPHLYVIDAEGVLRYNGAIDSIPSADPADLAEATQYVPAALAAVAAGQAPDPALTQPYGCSIKY
jgi:hypothetical protein